MISLKLADIFTNLAEIKKIDPSKKETVLSLIRGARTLRDDLGKIEKIIKGETPDTLDGIDEYCYGLVTEYLERGSIREYEQFSNNYSEDLIRLIRVTGLGKRRLFSIYDAFDIKDMEGLLEVFKDRKVREILGKSDLEKDILNSLFTERIQRSVEYFTGLTGRDPRWAAQFYADIMIGSLKKIREIKRIEYTGAVRRKKSLINDIDILVVPSFNDLEYNPDMSLQLLEKIARQPFIKKLKSVKSTKNDISACYSTVYEVDIEIIIVSKKTQAWYLFKTTGSKKHITQMEVFARENKGVELDNLSRKDMKSEEAIYRILDLQYIPPELREGRDEIMLSSRDKLPDLIEMSDIKGDLHIHSDWSDGLIKYSDIVETAKKLDYEYIAISDHSPSNYYGNGLDAGKLLKKMGFVWEQKKKNNGIQIFMGAEIDIKKPDLFDYSPGIIKKLDIAIGSLHSSFINSSEENTASVVSALKKDFFDFIAHPTGEIFGDRAPIFIDMDRVIAATAENKKALEINSYYMRLDLDEDNARKAAMAGAKLAINSDSHRPGNMEMVRLGVDVARRAGLESKDILNTMTASQLREWRENRLR